MDGFYQANGALPTINPLHVSQDMPGSDSSGQKELDDLFAGVAETNAALGIVPVSQSQPGPLGQDLLDLFDRDMPLNDDDSSAQPLLDFLENDGPPDGDDLAAGPPGDQGDDIAQPLVDLSPPAPIVIPDIDDIDDLLIQPVQPAANDDGAVAINLSQAQIQDAVDYKGVVDIREAEVKEAVADIVEQDHKETIEKFAKYNIPIGLTRSVARLFVTTAEQCGDKEAQPSAKLQSWMVGKQCSQALCKDLTKLELRRAVLVLFCQAYRLVVNLSKDRMDSNKKAELILTMKQTTNPYTWCRRQIKMIDKKIAEECKNNQLAEFKPDSTDFLPIAALSILGVLGNQELLSYYGGEDTLKQSLIRAICNYIATESIQPLCTQHDIFTVFTDAFQRTFAVLDGLTIDAEIENVLNINGKHYLRPVPALRNKSKWVPLLEFASNRYRDIYDSKARIAQNIQHFYSRPKGKVQLELINFNEAAERVRETIRYYCFFHQYLLAFHPNAAWNQPVLSFIQDSLTVCNELTKLEFFLPQCDKFLRAKYASSPQFKHEQGSTYETEVGRLQTRIDALVADEQAAREARLQANDAAARDVADQKMQAAHEAWMTWLHAEFPGITGIYIFAWDNRDCLPSGHALWNPRKGRVTRNRLEPKRKRRGLKAINADQSRHRGYFSSSSSSSSSESESDTSSESESEKEDNETEEEEEEDSLARDLEDLLSV